MKEKPFDTHTHTHTYTVKNKYFIFQVNIDCMFII